MLQSPIQFLGVRILISACTSSASIRTLKPHWLVLHSYHCNDHCIPHSNEFHQLASAHQHRREGFRELIWPNPILEAEGNPTATGTASSGHANAASGGVGVDKLIAGTEGKTGTTKV
ncbi:hypothetical protein H9Q70_000076 [Fusarium xylarioides]|nr:hypothetical protein H9Q70_000076 [Fusarium xylarioides]